MTRTEAGSKWRLLVHDPDPDRPGRYLIAHDITPDAEQRPDGEWSRHHIVPGAIFDEVVAGNWLHAEDMGAGADDEGHDITDGSSTWWVQVAGATLWVDVDKDGSPTSLRYYPPGTYADAVEGCDYQEPEP